MPQAEDAGLEALKGTEYSEGCVRRDWTVWSQWIGWIAWRRGPI